jgi:hypothetical protein
MSKYAPANEFGDKPYVVTQSGWGRKRSKIAYGKTAAEAKYRAFGRQGVGEYITGCRRATLEDMSARSEPSASEG